LFQIFNKTDVISGELLLDPQVTVGVCVRNCEQFLEDAIASIANQDYPHEKIKLVLVDDGSEDNTPSILNECVKGIDIESVALHTAWEGLGRARNRVVANAIGKYILWVDGDMVLSKNFLSQLVRFMEKNPRAAVIKGKQALIPGRNLLATLESYSRAAGRMVDYQSPQGQFKVVGTGGSLYRISAMTQVGGFDKNLRGYNEDWDMELRLRQSGWTLHTFDVSFQDYERNGLSWKLLWSRYWTRGYHTHYFLHKKRGLIKHYRMFPPAAFLAGLVVAFRLYGLTGLKAAFLLPFPSAFKMTAWYAGFVRSHLDSYAPDSLIC
jgi:glycosyltransferase involved in cell wall biosynthesis